MITWFGFQTDRKFLKRKSSPKATNLLLEMGGCHQHNLAEIFSSTVYTINLPQEV